MNRTLTLRLEEQDPDTGMRHVIEKIISCAELEQREDLQIALYSEYRKLSSALSQAVSRHRISEMPSPWAKT